MARRIKSKKRKRRYKLKKQVYLVLGAFILVLSLIFSINFLNGKISVDINQEDEDQEIIVKEQKKVKIVNLDSNSRNIAVMINNISKVWGYQSGLQDAYLVYEIITEGGITRLMAIFRDVNTARIGTIRSSRAYYLDYVLENDAIYSHVGGSPEALSDIKTLGINDLDLDAAWRDKSIGLATEHTVFSSIEKFNQKIAAKGYRTTSDKDLLLNYSAEEIDLSKIEGAQVANNVEIVFSASKNTSFVYDKEAGVYKRSQNGKAHIDYVTKNQYTVKNIITYQVDNSTYDYKGRQTLYNIGSGTGYFISNGYAVPITWEKSSRSAQTVYKYKNGEEIVVNDGNTHIEIQPKNKSITIN